MSSPRQHGADHTSFSDFGAQFFEHAVTEARILAALKPLAGDEIAFGPIGAGPGKRRRRCAW